MNAQDVTNLITALLGVATVWLAVETRRMANAAKASIELQTEPQLAVLGLTVDPIQLLDLVDPTANGIKVAIHLSNPGQVRVNYKMRDLRVEVSDVVYEGDRLETDGGTIHPKVSTSFTTPVIRLPHSIKAPATGKLEFSIDYWSVPSKISVVSGTLSLAFVATDPLTTQYHYSDGPNYA